MQDAGGRRSFRLVLAESAGVEGVLTYRLSYSFFEDHVASLLFVVR